MPLKVKGLTSSLIFSCTLPYLWPMQLDDTICALSTAPGMGAIAMLRVAGPQSFTIIDKIFQSGRLPEGLASARANQLYYGKIKHKKELIDEVMLGVYRAPHSYTGDDLLEISCHGSTYIQQKLLALLLEKGCRMADPGEFTFRAYFNGKMDLAQAEAVADLIASENKAAHHLAVQQMRGGFSEQIKKLRQELIDFASLIELELDFGEEDVEFAERDKLEALLREIRAMVLDLLDSYQTGNILKDGLAVAIVGAPNVGKSTLLNALLREEKAIVTEIAGTTRDAIEDEITIDGLTFRVIDTAGIRETADVVESIGIKKTFEKIDESHLTLYLFDAAKYPEREKLVQREIRDLTERKGAEQVLVVANKMDLAPAGFERFRDDLIGISARQKVGLEKLKEAMKAKVDFEALQGNRVIVSNARHYHDLQQSLADIDRVQEGLAQGISGDFLAQDIREALRHLGNIIGEVDVDRDILGNIFGKFCIGK